MPSTRILRPRTQTSMHSPGSLSRTPTRYSNRLSGRAETDRRIAMMSKPVDDDDVSIQWIICLKGLVQF